MKKTLFLVPILLLCAMLPAGGKNIESLEQQKRQTLDRIANTNRLIEQSEKSKKISTQKLSLIEQKIESRNALIKNLEKQTVLYGELIESKEKEIEQLEVQIKQLKADYAEFLRSAQFTTKSNQILLYILASENLMQFYRRLRFYREYLSYQREQHVKIQQKDSLLHMERDTLKIARGKIILIRREESKTREQMIKEKEQYDKEVQLLLGKEQELRKQMEADQRRIERINASIRQILAEEAIKHEKTKKTKKYKQSEKNFAKNMGQLPWPIAGGAITRNFGQQQSKLFKNVKTDSQGVDIMGAKNADVRAVAAGTISKIAHIPGGGDVVIIRHGKYLTLYSNLTALQVHVGDQVDALEVLGKGYSEGNSEHSTMHFEIWHGFKPKNPKKWLIP